jgi:hypothetical protein
MPATRLPGCGPIAALAREMRHYGPRTGSAARVPTYLAQASLAKRLRHGHASTVGVRGAGTTRRTRSSARNVPTSLVPVFGVLEIGR